MKRNKKPLTEHEFKKIYSKVPRVCVDLVVIVESKVLLTLRAKYGWIGLWHLPGGTIHLNETAIDAVKRVGKEELGKQFSDISFLGYQDWLHGEKSGSFGSGITLVFRCELENAKDVILDDQASKARLFDKIPRNSIREQKKWIEKGLLS